MTKKMSKMCFRCHFMVEKGGKNILEVLTLNILDIAVRTLCLPLEWYNEASEPVQSLCNIQDSCERSEETSKPSVF